MKKLIFSNEYFCRDGKPRYGVRFLKRYGDEFISPYFLNSWGQLEFKSVEQKDPVYHDLESCCRGIFVVDLEKRESHYIEMFCDDCSAEALIVEYYEDDIIIDGESETVVERCNLVTHFPAMEFNAKYTNGDLQKLTWEFQSVQKKNIGKSKKLFEGFKRYFVFAETDVTNFIIATMHCSHIDRKGHFDLKVLYWAIAIFYVLRGRNKLNGLYVCRYLGFMRATWLRRLTDNQYGNIRKCLLAQVNGRFDKNNAHARLFHDVIIIADLTNDFWDINKDIAKLMLSPFARLYCKNKYTAYQSLKTNDKRSV